MTKCVDISPKVKKICSGTLRHRISLYTRSLTAPAFGEQANQQTYALLATVRAAIQTVNGIKLFDDVAEQGPELSSVATTLFFIRHRDDVTAENYLRYKGQNYNILRVESIDLEGRWLKLYCDDRGSEDKEAAL